MWGKNKPILATLVAISLVIYVPVATASIFKLFDWVDTSVLLLVGLVLVALLIQGWLEEKSEKFRYIFSIVAGLIFIYWLLAN